MKSGDHPGLKGSVVIPLFFQSTRGFTRPFLRLLKKSGPFAGLFRIFLGKPGESPTLGVFLVQ